jgi:hypothetical protein
MPEEWRLAYYQTQYPCVWLEERVWRGTPHQEMLNWLNDTRDDFRFVLEGASSADKDGMDAVPNDARMITNPDARIIWFDMDTNLESLPRRLLDVDTLDDIYLICRDANLEALQRVATLLELLGL